MPEPTKEAKEAPLTVLRGGELSYNREQIDLIKRTVAHGTTDDELKLFLYTAQRMGLDPLLNQIHAVKRWNAQAGREVMAIQVAIDGYRLVADRTGHYAPGPEPKFEYDKDGKLVYATAYVRKLVSGTWHDVAATAHMAEYAQKKKDGSYTRAWMQMPHIMLGKCAEALAIRKAFPAETAGSYTDDEMQQADNALDVSREAQVETPKHAAAALPAPPPQPNGITEETRAKLDLLLSDTRFTQPEASHYAGLVFKHQTEKRAQAVIGIMEAALNERGNA